MEDGPWLATRPPGCFEQAYQRFAKAHRRHEAALLPFAGGNVPPPGRQAGKHGADTALQIRRDWFRARAENDGPDVLPFSPQGAHQRQRIGPVVCRIMRAGTDEGDWLILNHGRTFFQTNCSQINP